MQTGHNLKSHPTDWRSPGLNLQLLVYKTTDFTTIPWRFLFLKEKILKLSHGGGWSALLLFASFAFHQENMSVKFIPSYIPFLYSKSGVCRGIAIFL